MLSGHNYARAMRAHLLVYAALHNILLKAICNEVDEERSLLSFMNIHVDCIDTGMTDLKKLFESSLNGDIDVDDSHSLDCQCLVSLSLNSGQSERSDAGIVTYLQDVAIVSVLC